MSLPFDNKVVLITGAGSGIGRELALQMAARGAVVAALDLHPEPLQNLITELKECNCGAGWEVGDVTDRPALHRAIDAFTRRLGPIEILVASAGIGMETSATNWQAAQVEKQIAVNLVGVANSIEAVLPGMLERKRGHLVAISSAASYRGVAHLAGYCASKAGVNAMMDSLRLELRPRGIHCTTICPGWIRTPLTANIRMPMLALQELDVSCRRMVRAIERRQPFLAFPGQIRWPLQVLQLLPARLSDWLLVNFLGRLARRSKRS
jgi:NAD(P)-dependent dehydrogenase (short-subunit alcohol dehydrogenase family)